MQTICLGGVEDETTQKQFKLLTSPNPFSNGTWISYTLPGQANVKLDIINTSGQLVSLITEEKQATGEHKFYWNFSKNTATTNSRGVYIIRLQVDGITETIQVIKAGY